MAFPNENQKLYMVTGKGGVGKSVVAAAMARSLAQRGQRTVLVELGDESYFGRLYGRTVTEEPQILDKNLWLARWSGESCLREYVQHLLKIKKVADLFFDNKIMRTFIKASPALKELAILGKVTSGVRQWGPELNYDAIVVDAFATGHYTALLRAPQGMGELIETGPMGEQSRSITAVLSSKKICKHIIVTLPEELPVSEAIELKAELRVLLGQEAQVICNRYYNCALSLERVKQLAGESRTAGAKKFADYLVQYIERQEKQIQILDAELSPYGRLPMVFSPDSRDVITELTEHTQEYI